MNNITNVLTGGTPTAPLGPLSPAAAPSTAVTDAEVAAEVAADVAAELAKLADDMAMTANELADMGIVASAEFTAEVANTAQAAQDAQANAVLAAAAAAPPKSRRP